MKKLTTSKLSLSPQIVARLQPRPLDQQDLGRVAGGTASFGGYCYTGDWHTYGCGGGSGGGTCGGGDY